MNSSVEYTSGFYRLYSSIGEKRNCVGIAAEEEASSILSIPVTLVGRLDDVCLKQPLDVLLESDNDAYIVSESLFNVYGEGNDPSSALSDYKSAFADYAKMLLDRKDESEQDLAQFNRIEKYVSFPR